MIYTKNYNLYHLKHGVSNGYNATDLYTPILVKFNTNFISCIK